MKGFPAEIFGGYTTGQGFAGIFGSFYYLALKYMHFTVQSAFLILLPVYICFYFIFISFIQTKVKYDELYQSKKSQKVMEREEAKSNKKLDWTNFKVVLKKSWFYNTVLASSYFFAYGITGYLLKRATNNMATSKEFKEIGYETILVLLQLGILVSSSSLSYFKINRVYLVMMMEFLNYLTFFLYVGLFSAPFLLITAQMIASGFLMGLIYVNSFYQLLNDKQIEKTEKEITLNLTILFKDVSIIASSGAGFVFNKYVL